MERLQLRKGARSMADYSGIERGFLSTLKLEKRPVAIKFQNEPPAGVSKFTGTEPSGCSFWRLASAGRTFYTVPSDHYNCPIGSHTHNIPLPPERAQELDQTLSLMIGAGYLKMEEIPGIPQLSQTPGVVIFAPLGDTPVDPDVVLFAGRPGSIMLLQEAALRAGRASQFPVLGRPTCMALPAAIAQGAIVSSGCIGNRVYTNLKENELYIAVPGKDLEAIANELKTIAAANILLSNYHQRRRESLATE
jgi:uncharacterized protein (DUF169 family)